jgi:acyl-CoA thioesterase-1
MMVAKGCKEWFLAGLIFLLTGLMIMAEATETPGRVLILGDSLAAGSGVLPEQAFPALLQQKINQEKLPYQVVNAGVSGDTSSGGVRRIHWLLKRPVEILLLELGANDGLRGMNPSITQTNLQKIINITRTKYPKVRIVLAGMKMPANMGREYTDAFEKVFPDLARDNKAELIPFLLEGIGADPEYNQPDMIHPNPRGHQVVAETVWKILLPLLEEKAAGAESGDPVGKPAVPPRLGED